MNLNKNKSLKYFVYVVLARRILVVTLIFSTILAIIVYFNASRNIYQHVQITAHDRFETLRARTNEYMEIEGTSLQQAVNQAIDALSRIRYDKSLGAFVFYQINTQEAGVLADKYNINFPHINEVKHYIESNTSTTNYSNSETFQEIIQLESSSYVHLVMPIHDKSGKFIGHLNALFALSQVTMDELSKRIYTSVFYAVMIVLLTTAMLYPVIVTLTRKLAGSSIDLLDSNIETLQVLGSAIAKRDSDTNAHNYRVTIIATRLAEKINLPAKQIESLIKGAFLHDVGKIGISDNVLLKPGKLTDDEFTVMKTHVEKGLEIVDRSTWLTTAQDIVGCHHEKFDGSGYPKGLQADKIPINARIFAISDVFDALTSERPYKKPFSFEKTMQILEESSGTHFDPELIDNFKLIAFDLYQELKGKDDEQLRLMLGEITQKYYSAGLDSLLY